MASNDIQVVVKAIDEFSAAMKSFQTSVQKMGTDSQAAEQHVKSLGDRMSGFGSILQGMAIGAGIALFNALSDAVGQLVDAIPNAIAQGYAWAEQIHQLELETGMTAEQTSSLAAVMRQLGVPMDNANRLFAMFGKQLDTNEKLFTSLGVATRTANGDYLDTYTIIHELQEAFSAHGDSLTKTAAAQELFSRTGFTMLEFLNLTDAQMQAFTVNAGNAGMILDESTTDAAHRFGIQMGDLGNIITGIQTSIFAGLEPTLEGFVSSFGNFIEAHMNDIVSFVVGVANFVMGVIGSIFGIDLGSVGGSAGGPGGESPSAPLSNTPMKTPAPASSGGYDPYAEAIKAQTRAIQDQIDAMTKLNDTEKATEEQAKLEKAIADAKTELANLQDSQVNTYGLSAAEQVKALQKRDADILKAQDKIQTTEVSLADWKTQQSQDAAKTALEDQKKALADQLAAHEANNRSVAAGLKTIPPIVSSTFTGLNSSLSAGLKDFSATAQSALAQGKAAGESLKIVLGQVWDFITKSVVPSFQSLIGWVTGLNDLLGTLGLGGIIGTLTTTTQLAFTPLRLLIEGITGLINAFGDLWDWLGRNVPGLEGLKNKTAGAITHAPVSAPVYTPAGKVAPGTYISGHPDPTASYAQGTNWVPEDGLAYLHRGEEVRPVGANSGHSVVNFQIDGRTLFQFIDGELARRGSLA